MCLIGFFNSVFSYECRSSVLTAIGYDYGFCVGLAWLAGKVRRRVTKTLKTVAFRNVSVYGRSVVHRRLPRLGVYGRCSSPAPTAGRLWSMFIAGSHGWAFMVDVHRRLPRLGVYGRCSSPDPTAGRLWSMFIAGSHGWARTAQSTQRKCIKTIAV